MYQAIKQLEEKIVAIEIEKLLWSDLMDLVALSNIKGEVALHRLSWARAWILGPYKEGATVKDMAWKPDGKALAVGYSTGHVLLVNVENKAILHKLEVKADISCIIWSKEKIDSKRNKVTSDHDDQKDYMKYLDCSSIFLPDPPLLSTFSSSNTSEENFNSTHVQNQTELNMIVIGTEQGLIFISIFGYLPCATLDVNKHVGYRCSVISILLSEHLDLLFATIRDEFGNVKVVILSIEMFESHDKELFAIAMKHERLNCLLNYLSSTISVIKETWESILLEMDAKLSKYASKVPEGTLAADFLDLLMFGITSEDMQEFLLHDLTKKGLEKFGQSIEMSYANIQKLLLKNITKMGQYITFHLAELRGMARLECRYKLLGLVEDKISDAISSNGAFLNKSGEMQQIINMSMINYKAFFRWLYMVIMHLIDEAVPTDMPKMTQQDLAYITEFLQNFDNIGPRQSPDGSMKSGFIMEKLGQYLVDSPLTISSTMDTNEWNRFLNDNECVKNHPSIIKHYKDMSLVQQFNHLRKSIDEIFHKPKLSITEQFKLKQVINCMYCPDYPIRLTSINCSPTAVLFVFLPHKPPADGLYFLELNTSEGVTGKGGYVFIPQFIAANAESCGENYHIMDVQFYTQNIVSVLMQENSLSRSGLMYQCPAVVIRETVESIDLSTEIARQDLIRIDACSLGNSLLRKTEGMIALQFAVSGYRRVAVVLAENRRKIRMYEMEAEEEEEEDADMSNDVTRESDSGE